KREHHETLSATNPYCILMNQRIYSPLYVVMIILSFLLILNASMLHDILFRKF
ncbi:hypothetical protein WUBG_14003, partial [Wuchereria bancrofti]